MINMREAYLKVLGLDQKPLEEKKMARPSWVPESIKDNQVSDFMGALAAAHKGGSETFEFNEKKYKMTVGKKMEEAVKVDDDESMIDKDGEDKKDDDDGKKVCEECGKMHEGSCSTKKEELSPKQKKIDHNKNGKIDGEDLAKIRKESAEHDDFIKSLEENGFDQDEIDSIISKLEEKTHVGTGGPPAAEAEEMGETLSDGELDFIELHDIEVIDMHPEDPKHHDTTKQATPPTTKGIGTAEVDGQKIVSTKPEVAVKSQATAPKTK